MKTYSVNLKRTEDVLDFVKIVNTFDGDVDLKSGSVVIDAKSLMGAICMTGKKRLEMVVHSSDCDHLVHKLSAYLCA